MTLAESQSEFESATAPIRENAIARIRELATPRVRHCEKCPRCGGTVTDTDEFSSHSPWGTGWVLRQCEMCDLVLDRRWVGH
jgi:hypothetical protein